MALNHTRLKNITQKSIDSFKEYGQRWRELVAQVQPPMLDRELTDMFMGTLQVPYLENMTSSASSTLSDLVTIEECIEGGLKSGRIWGASSIQTSKRESLSDCQRKRRMKLIQYGKLLKLCKIYLRCLTISNLYISTVQSQQPFGPPYLMPFPPHGQYPLANWGPLNIDHKFHSNSQANNNDASTLKDLKDNLILC